MGEGPNRVYCMGKLHDQFNLWKSTNIICKIETTKATIYMLFSINEEKKTVKIQHLLMTKTLSQLRLGKKLSSIDTGYK